MSKPIFEWVDSLPTGGITVMALRSLDFTLPGQWQNLVGFDNTIRAVTGETDEELTKQIGDRAVALALSNRRFCIWCIGCSSAS
jgi:hypothetical protein